VTLIQDCCTNWATVADDHLFELAGAEAECSEVLLLAGK